MFGFGGGKKFEREEKIVLYELTPANTFLRHTVWKDADLPFVMRDEVQNGWLSESDNAPAYFSQYNFPWADDWRVAVDDPASLGIKRQPADPLAQVKRGAVALESSGLLLNPETDRRDLIHAYADGEVLRSEDGEEVRWSAEEYGQRIQNRVLMLTEQPAAASVHRERQNDAGKLQIMNILALGVLLGVIVLGLLLAPNILESSKEFLSGGLGGLNPF